MQDLKINLDLTGLNHCLNYCLAQLLYSRAIVNLLDCWCLWQLHFCIPGPMHHSPWSMHLLEVPTPVHLSLTWSSTKHNIVQFYIQASNSLSSGLHKYHFCLHKTNMMRYSIEYLLVSKNLLRFSLNREMHKNII